MRRLGTLAVLSALMSPTAASGYTFGDWASDHGYSPGDVMPEKVDASSSAIDSLSGIGVFGWTFVPTTYLNLYNNRLSSIEASDFHWLTKLTELRLDDNELSSIEAGDFNELTNLETLWLHRNQISSIESDAFSGLTNLTYLALNSNDLSSIESGDFDGLANLTYLGLWENQISSIESNAFSELTNLETLRLDRNRLSSVESGAFGGLAKLTSLWLGDNPALTELNLDEADFSNLTEFDVEGNWRITSVSLRNTVMNQTSLAKLLRGGENVGIGELHGITEMDLSGIDFGNITGLGALYAMSDLTDLWLVNTRNLEAGNVRGGLDRLLDNLATMEGTDTEGTLYMTQANFDAFNTAGNGLLAAWDAEQGHHVEILLLGDMDGDGDADYDDIEGFVLGLTLRRPIWHAARVEGRCGCRRRSGLR